MQSDRRYKVDKYLEMARITRTEYKKDHYLDMAETYLEMDDVSTLTSAQNTIDWLSELDKEYFLGMSVTDMYENYLAYAKENGINVESRYLMSRRIRETFGLSTKRARVPNTEHGTASVYY